MRFDCEIKLASVILFSLVMDSSAFAQAGSKNESALYHFQNGMDMRWSSPENPNGAKGNGGKENNGAKGRPYLTMHPGDNLEMLNIRGMGIVHRIWITITQEAQEPEALRSLSLNMFWDGNTKPAVSVPFGDFFGTGLGRKTVMENALFANPEGKSFNCFIPMPFRTGAKISITNNFKKDVDIYYDVDYTLTDKWDADNLYFHAYWHRDTATILSKDFEILPKVSGKGRYLGSNIGVNGNPAYETTWFGEGEFKLYKDGDTKWPTLNGTGTEDFIGTAWGQKKFIHQYTGCTVADPDHKQWAFYRYHIVDPIFFNTDCRVTIQQLGGSWMPQAQRFQESGVPMIPVTTGDDAEFRHVYNHDRPLKLDTTQKENGWTNFYRSDDVSAIAYFYLDKPFNELPPLQPLSIRIYALRADHK
ncbi:MAG: DUF2961 domain-containing protein [Chitinophagaceae bacterium]|nr:DUF2961 domain-containing protein [Chitinophagaceae bacterium]